MASPGHALRFSGSSRQVQLGATEVAVGLNSDPIVRAGDCLYSESGLFPALFKIMSDDFIVGILTANTQKLAKCSLDLVGDDAGTDGRFGEDTQCCTQ